MLDPTEKQYLATVQDYKNVFESESGKNILYDLMKSGFFLNATFSDNIYEMAYREGRRSVILNIIGALNMDIKTLEKEIRERSTNERNRIRSIYK